LRKPVFSVITELIERKGAAVDLRQLEVFCRIVELKSFSRAAEAVFLTQPTVSQHVSALESFFDLQLLDRRGKEIQPTRAGELLYQYAQEILHLKEKACQSLSHYAGKKSGHLRVGASTIPGEYVLPALLGAFREAFPEITVTLSIGDTRQIIDAVAAGRIEIGIVGAKIKSGQLAYQSLVEDRIVLAASRKSALWNRESIRPADLLHIPLIQREDGSGTRLSLEKALAAHRVDYRSLRVTAEIGSTEAVKQAVLAGMGVSFLSERAIVKEKEYGLLREVPVRGIDIRRSFYSVLNRKKAPSPICKEFKAFLAKQGRE
jgi:DNA-binding transcriptional LysR family regulator